MYIVTVMIITIANIFDRMNNIDTDDIVKNEKEKKVKKAPEAGTAYATNGIACVPALL